MQGHHQQDLDLEEDYLDWFFLHYFQKDPTYWRSLAENKLITLITLEQEKEKEFWDNWAKMFKQLFGGK